MINVWCIVPEIMHATNSLPWNIVMHNTYGTCIVYYNNHDACHNPVTNNLHVDAFKHKLQYINNHILTKYRRNFTTVIGWIEENISVEPAHPGRPYQD